MAVNGESARCDGDMDPVDANNMLVEAVRGMKIGVANEEGPIMCDFADVKFALANGATVSREVMQVGVSRKIPGLVKVLLDGGGDANGVTVEEFGTLGGGTMLGYAVERGSLAVVEVLLAGGALPDGCEDDGVTPLMWAAYCNRSTCVAALIEAGANVNVCDEAGRTALLLAASDSDCQIIEMLLDAGADPNMSDNYDTTPLMVRDVG